MRRPTRAIRSINSLIESGAFDVDLVDDGLLPLRAGLQPEGRRGHRLRAVTQRLPAKALRDLAVGIDAAGVEFLPLVP